jgi:lysozyme
VYAGMSITREQADAILAADLASVEIEVAHLITAPINQKQFDALVSFQFNTGALGKRTCSLRKDLNLKRYNDAAHDFLKYTKAGGRTLEGLVRRRKAEKALFEEKL